MSKQNTGNNLIANFATTNSILPAKIGVDISIGDFLVFNKNDNTVVPLDYNVAGINDSLFNIEANFIGVAIQTNSAGNIQAGYEAFPQENFYGITVATEMLYLANCDSATWQFGELVQAVVGNPNKVAKCTDQNLAIGYVAGDYTVSATSRVRVRLISGKYSPYTNQNLQGPVSLSIGSGNIVSGMLGNGSVVSGSVASGQIGINHLASGTVAGAFGPSSITSGLIASGNVCNFHLSSGASLANLLSGSIGSGLLANNSVISGSIASGQIGNFHLSSGAVTSGDIGDAAVVSGSIAAAVIGTPHIANAAIVSGLLGSGQIGRFHISSGAVVKALTQGTNITITADANDNYTINSTGGGGGGTAAVDLPNQFRLSVTSGVAIDSNVTSGATLIHLVPFIGNKIALFSGSTWGNVYSSGAVNISAVTLASGQIYDIFAFNNAGVPALEYSAAWSTGITSGGAGPITSTRTDGISFVNGIPVKSSDNTRRLVGTVMGTISGRTAMTDTTKGVTNYDNQVPLKIDMRKVNNHAYIQANASGIGAAQIWATDITTLCRWVSPIDGTVGQMGLQTQLARENGTGFVGIGFFGNCINSGVMFPLDSASNIRSSFRPPMVKSAVSGDGLEAASGPCPITNKAGYNFIYPEEFCTASGALRSYTLEVAGTITG